MTIDSRTSQSTNQAQIAEWLEDYGEDSDFVRVRVRGLPACEALRLPHATWLTFRRTYSSWSHDKGVPGKVVAQLMGHAKVDTTLNVYTQVLDGSLRAAVETTGSELFTHRREAVR